MKTVLLVSFDTDEPVSVDGRLALKEWYGEITRTALRTDGPVAVTTWSRPRIT